MKINIGKWLNFIRDEGHTPDCGERPPITAYSDGTSDWQVTAGEFRGPGIEASRDIHIYPLDDLRYHVMTRECWCKPTVDTEEASCIIHHSMDGREQYETGKSKLS